MRQISAKLLDPESLLELESGHRLQIVSGGRTIAEVVPASRSETEQAWKTESERLAAGMKLLELLHEGYHLDGLRIENRDELYDRD